MPSELDWDDPDRKWFRREGIHPAPGVIWLLRPAFPPHTLPVRNFGKEKATLFDGSSHLLSNKFAELRLGTWDNWVVWLGGVHLQVLRMDLPSMRKKGGMR